MVSMLLIWGLWQTRAWVRYALLGTGAAFTVWYWSDRYLFQMADVNWPFALVVNVLLLIILIVYVFTPDTITYLSKREAHDR